MLSLVLGGWPMTVEIWRSRLLAGVAGEEQFLGHRGASAPSVGRRSRYRVDDERRAEVLGLSLPGCVPVARTSQAQIAAGGPAARCEVPKPSKI